ncbi:YbaB/EbfC family nucleoid-associated protein [Nonomuraea sp. NN258]|uniref:YbaB/EbfC family nucleoid-associated protein n=1 Tax=Nonomuraea antri TaxID=2730852 RepID=UPI001567D77C|nr:YbaB/EbfC family nucleoid-associated protein [Nonomuraea antri]NRQ40855.1 YbaB/EbfC family nucleoid-associated protein [Nonomuraea antri]
MDTSHSHLHELDRLVQAGERSMRELDQAMRDLRQLSGEGESRSGSVTARVDADSKLVDVRIAPRAMRLGSDELSREVVEAVRAAQDAHQRQAQDLLGFTPAGDENLLATFQRDLTEIQDAYAAETADRIDRLRRTQRAWND